LLLSSAILVTACSVDPEPLQQADINKAVVADQAVISDNQEAIVKPLTLREAMARSIAYNLDHRTRLMEEALAHGQFSLATYDMLPTLAASAGYVGRDSELASSSESILTRRQSLEPSTSQDEWRQVADLRLNWNVLDFGVSYFQAKQQADRFLISQLNRQKLMLRLLQQTRTAYWRAASSQMLKPEVSRVLQEARGALADVERTEKQRLQPPQVTLQYRRALLEILSQLETLQQSLSTSEVELASMINVPPRTPLALSLPTQLEPLPKIDLPVSDLELIALQKSPDIAEQMYNARIDQAEARKAILRLLPGIELGASYNYDSNSYLVDQSWGELTSRVTWNLFRLLSIDSVMDLQKARENLAVTRRLAFNMAVVTRVNVAWRRYMDAQSQFDRAQQINDVEQNIAELTATQEQANAQSQVERVRNDASALRAALRRMEAYASAQDSLGALFLSLSLNPVPDNFREMDIAQLVGVLDNSMTPWEHGALPKPEEAPQAVAKGEQPAAADQPAQAGDTQSETESGWFDFLF
jgi:outer membrane protein TolC